jgi:probable F420-dependent oxidoreductase
VSTTELPELGFYTLGGQPDRPRELIAEVRHAEAMGLGHTFISERFNTKEAATLSGAAAAVSERIGIATAATNHNTRHPVLTASYALTMHRLTGGRFTLGIGRGVRPLQDAFGMAPVTTAQMEDFAGVMRRLFRGETIVGHDGPIGRYPALRLGRDYCEDIPLGLVAFGPDSLALGGRAFDQVVLHTFFTDETLARCVRTVKRAAERAGRDPAMVQGVVVFRHDWRSSARGVAAAEDGRPTRHLSSGVRRLDGAHERLGSPSAATVPGRCRGAELPSGRVDRHR